MTRTAKREIPARIVVVDPPDGVAFGLQRGRRELGPIAVAAGAELAFDLRLRVDGGSDGSPRFSGEFVHGPAGGKFVYVNSGTLAGQEGSCWTRRAKVGLREVSWAVIDRVASSPAAVLQARIAGRARDGGPACASVPLLEGWTVETGA